MSPQRLAHYRDNWYLDSWCHMRKALRSFAVDAIDHVDPLENEPAREIDEAELEKTLGTGYGIFAGYAVHKALLRFTAEAARWVSREKWHSNQQSEYDSEGSYLLTVPYANETELIMDILRYGPEVEVISPDSLRKQVQKRLHAASVLYNEMKGYTK